ncbi:SAP domain-containing protein [Aphis craccivora]|uniref:SAP domain-containing protein n=1 Tax=Aphis craccivora TaxID=307492 RepID=A0A6G0VST0_APHCR|nr:SAP domain-containing protein [Aphis craccivora]
MAGKYMNELTAAELRYECSQRGLPEGGTKDAFEIRLEQHFTSLGIPANSARFQPVETSRQPKLDTDKNPAHNAGHIESSTGERTPVLRPSDATHPTPTQTAQQAADLVQAARGMIKEARQTVENTPHRHSLESRLTMLENCMARFGEDQRRIVETMRRLELGISRPTPEPQPEVSEPTRPQYASSSGQHRGTPKSPPADSA